VCSVSALFRFGGIQSLGFRVQGGMTIAALRGLCPTALQGSELNDFFVWSELSWFQLKAASPKAALN